MKGNGCKEIGERNGRALLHLPPGLFVAGDRTAPRRQPAPGGVRDAPAAGRKANKCQGKAGTRNKCGCRRRGEAAAAGADRAQGPAQHRPHAPRRSRTGTGMRNGSAPDPAHAPRSRHKHRLSPGPRTRTGRKPGTSTEGSRTRTEVPTHAPGGSPLPRPPEDDTAVTEPQRINLPFLISIFSFHCHEQSGNNT